jgi:PHD/YefM family antitoxin component YafN of YafNO toxin-antitoxin module
MSISFEHSIFPMSDLRANLEKIKKQLAKTPIIITNKGRPDFGICDLNTLAIAVQIKDLKDLLKKRMGQKHQSQTAEEVFRRLDEKYSVSS